jgi:ADP-ribose pyrophosphatase YjhB (NUDIX family)
MITENYLGKSGVKYIFEYEDCDDFSELPYDKCRQIYGVCFYNDKITIVLNGKKKTWGLVGGTIEKGEKFDQTFRREIQEESNMEVLSWKPIGYQKVIDTRDNSFVYQLRVVALVRPYGEFVEDPAGSVTEIKLIDPKDYKQYFDWGAIGERIMERALELKGF